MTRKLTEFGTEAYPMHPSGMRNLTICPMRGALQFLAPIHDEGGPAGDTGSAMHKASAVWHCGASIADALEAMGAHKADYPNADIGDAANLFLKYAADPRNSTAKFACIEQSIKFHIAPHPTDPTGQPIVCIGKTDQVREVGGKLKVHDIKTSKKQGHAQLRTATMQMAAYCIGASIHLGKRVDPGALIMPRQYISGGPVFWHFTWTFDDCEQILAGVRLAVARIRAGDIHHMPGDDCEWCQQKSPDLCLPKLKELKMRGAV